MNIQIEASELNIKFIRIIKASCLEYDFEDPILKRFQIQVKMSSYCEFTASVLCLL